MYQYFRLLRKVADEFNIEKGLTEDEIKWKARLLYSLLSQIAYASLYDINEDLEHTSIVHFKNKIKNSLAHLLMMYPELERVFHITEGEKTIACEIYDVFLSAGCIYHEPNRIRPCIERCSQGNKCVFMRGQAIDKPKSISGAGSFVLSKDFSGQNIAMPSVEEMFLLQRQTLKQQWEHIVSQSFFTTLSSDITFEYLRTSPPFKNGYWGNAMDSTGEISLARTTKVGRPIYYLYKSEGFKTKLSRLPDWMTEDYNYRNVAVPCLAARGTLPETVFQVDGPIVTLRIGYLFPPAELHFIKLYSWPVVFREFPNDFNRIMNRDVFYDVKTILERVGYQFKEA